MKANFIIKEKIFERDASLGTSADELILCLVILGVVTLETSLWTMICLRVTTCFFMKRNA